MACKDVIRRTFTQTGMIGLGDLPGGDYWSHAHDASSDGSVIVGRGSVAFNSGSVYEAFRWTEADGMIGLGDLAGGDFTSVAWDVSGDGSVIVGFGTTEDGQEAFIWNEADGMLSLQDVLTNNGVDMSGWQLREAWGVSPDGRYIVGVGINPDGFEEGWLVSNVPEPSTLALSMIASVVFGAGVLVRKRKRKC